MGASDRGAAPGLRADRGGIPISVRAVRAADVAALGGDGGLRVVNRSRGTTLADRVEVATSSWARARGVMGQRSLPEGFGLVIAPCGSVHLFLVRVPLDIVHLDAAGVVLRVVSLRPWSVGPRVRGSAVVVEVPAGVAARAETRVGDVIVLTTGGSGSERNALSASSLMDTTRASCLCRHASAWGWSVRLGSVQSGQGIVPNRSGDGYCT